MTRLTRTQIQELLDSHGLQPSRALGQNFLCEAGVVDKIVRLSGVRAGDRVVEIGPGLGSLTLGLAEAGAHVTAVETDRYLIPALTEVVQDLDPPVSVVHADATVLDWSELLGPDSSPSDQTKWHVVANLPYNIATPLILDLLASEPRLTDWLVMVQLEAGDRLAADAGSKTYGIPSVLLAYWAKAEVVSSISNTVFLPVPKVSSALVRITRHVEPVIDAPFKRYATLVRAGFGQRRKMLRRSLSAHLTSEQIESAGVAPTDRAEQVSPEAWGRLANLGDS